MRYALLIVLMLSALPAVNGFVPAVQAAEAKTVTLAVENMTCSLCPITVRKALEAVPGVIAAKADYGTRTATVTFDPERTNVQALTAATAHAGYPATPKK